MNIWKLRKFFLTEYRWHHPSCFRAVTPAVQAAINIEIPLQPCSDTIINPWHARSSVLSGVLCQPTSLSSVFTLRCGTKVSTVGRPAFPPRKSGRYGYNCGFNWISESRTKQDFLLCFLLIVSVFLSYSVYFCIKSCLLCWVFLLFDWNRKK